MSKTKQNKNNLYTNNVIEEVKYTALKVCNCFLFFIHQRSNSLFNLRGVPGKILCEMVRGWRLT